ncbi:MAG: zf-HC2 domain-containing protein [Nocardiopsaceae bacterium]|nr:zf-HC2 domain-containing protein [Nocardiopsaceae bacterium]
MTTSLGVYVLGAAEPDERRKIEAHLPHCQSCRDELNRLAPIPGLLLMVPPEAVPRPQSHASGHRSDPQPGRGERIKHRGRGRLLGALAAVAASVAVASAVITGAWGGGSSPARHGGNTPVTLSGVSQASHVQATARMLDTSWGTSIRLTIRGAPINERCRLVVRSKAGGTETTGVWEAWRDGPITVPASAALRTSDIASLAIMAGARTLVTITASPPSAAGPSSQ